MSPRFRQWPALSPLASEFDSGVGEGKLQKLRIKMYCILDRGIPKANLILPTINLDSLEQLNYVTQGYFPVGAGSLEMANRGSVASSDLKAKATQAQRKLQEARLELEAVAQERIERAQGSKTYQLIIPIPCAILAILAAFAMAFWRSGQCFAAVLGAILTSLGFYASWKSRAQEQFHLANGVIEAALSKLYDSLDIVDYELLGPLEELNRTIEAIAREQKAGLENGSATGRDVAGTLALKDLLAGYDTTLANALLTARWELSAQVDSIWNSSFRIMLPTSKGIWDVFLVTISCDVLFVVNVFASIALAYFLTPPHAPYDYVARHIRTYRKAAQNATFAKALNITVATAAAAAAALMANHSMSVEAALAATGNHTSAMPRLLKGHGHNPGRSGPGVLSQTEGPHEFHGVVLLGAPVVFTGAGSMPSWDVTLSYMLPVCFEVLLSTVQLLTMFFLSRTSKTIAFANCSIAAMQDAINDVLETVTGPVVEQLNLQFRLVRWQADSTFNELRDLKV